MHSDTHCKPRLCSSSVIYSIATYIQVAGPRKQIFPLERVTAVYSQAVASRKPIRHAPALCQYGSRLIRPSLCCWVSNYTARDKAKTLIRTTVLGNAIRGNSCQLTAPHTISNPLQKRANNPFQAKKPKDVKLHSRQRSYGRLARAG